MITRKDYLEKCATHREYYSQFVTPGVVQSVRSRFGDRIKKSNDPHFNDIPLAEWDAMKDVAAYCGMGEKMELTGDYLTLSGCVCILKEAAEQIREQNL